MPAQRNGKGTAHAAASAAPHPAPRTARQHTTPREGSLTPKQEAFCIEYIKDLNATQAAIRAGYGAKGARSVGSIMLRNRNIVARLGQLQSARIERCEVDADFVLSRLVEELQAKAADVYDPETGALLPVHMWPDVWQRGLVTSIQTTELYGFDKDGKQTVVGQAKNVTFADRVKRIELLGKHISVQAFRERVALGADSPLTQLFKEIQGQAIRPALPASGRASSATHEGDEQ